MKDFPAIIAQNLTKRFGDFTAVDGVNFEVHPGEIFGFLGPNGSGKTTTIRMLLGLVRPTAGEVQVLGLPVGEVICSSKSGGMTTAALMVPRLSASSMVGISLTYSACRKVPVFSIETTNARLAAL